MDNKNELVDKFASLQTEAAKLNREIASLEGARNEVVRQLDGMGITPETLDATITKLQESIAKYEQDLAQGNIELETKITEVKGILNGN